jgi:SAM-dependent methyltransferase
LPTSRAEDIIEIAYPGSELDLFAEARNWKAYWSSLVRPLLGARILDVGAGLGATAGLLASGAPRDWLALEPDPALVSRMLARRAAGDLPDTVRVRLGTLADLQSSEAFDTILYCDVIEHIEHDDRELAQAARHLSPGGRLVVLAPAHEWLFTPFDAAIGHFRRYTRQSLAAAAPAGLTCERLDYLDSAGLLASLANRLLLRSAHPSPRQIRLWDRGLVPVSRVLDPLFGRRLGKSVLGVWRNTAERG